MFSIPIMQSETKNEVAPINDKALKLQLYEYMVMRFIEIIKMYNINTKIIEVFKDLDLMYIQMIEIKSTKTIIPQAIYAPGLEYSFPDNWIMLLYADAQIRCDTIMKKAPT